MNKKTTIVIIILINSILPATLFFHETDNNMFNNFISLIEMVKQKNQKQENQIESEPPELGRTLIFIFGFEAAGQLNNSTNFSNITTPYIPEFNFNYSYTKVDVTLENYSPYYSNSIVYFHRSIAELAYLPEEEFLLVDTAYHSWYDQYRSLGYAEGEAGSMARAQIDINMLARALYFRIIESGEAFSKIHIIGHSMGGLIARALVCSYYTSLKEYGYQIEAVATLGTPNHGTSLISRRYQISPLDIDYAWVIKYRDTLQASQMGFESPFIHDLNVDGDETPYDDEINWVTVAGWAGKYGRIWNPGLSFIYGGYGLVPCPVPPFGYTILAPCIAYTLGICWAWIIPYPCLIPYWTICVQTIEVWNDKLVDIWSVPLKGAKNEYTPFDHQGLLAVGLAYLNDEWSNEFTAKLFSAMTGGIIQQISFTQFQVVESPSADYNIRISVHISSNIGNIIKEDFVYARIDGDVYYFTPCESCEDVYYMDLRLDDGDYSIQIFAEDSEDNLEWWTEGISIADDDNCPPNIAFLPKFTPENRTFNDSVVQTNLSWAISDYSGLSQVEVKLNDALISNEEIGYHLVGNDLGNYKWELYALDNDQDRPDDQLSSYKSQEFTIIDDDTTPPCIDISYMGGNTDGNPGTWMVTAIDEESEIDTIKVQIDDGQPFEIISGSAIDVPNSLGIHTIMVEAINGDLDRGTIDQESTITSDSQIIVDDDTIHPTVTNLIIEDNFLNVQVALDASDDSTGDDEGISNIDIFVDGELILNYVSTPFETSFNFEFSNDWIMEFGTHKVEIQVTDADDDRPADSLTTIVNSTFKTSVEDMSNYILYEIPILKDDVDQRVNCPFNRMIINQLERAEILIQDALSSYLDDSIVKSIILDKLAKAHVELSDVITTILDWLTIISPEDSDYILDSLHEIRDHITLTMGAIVGTDEAVEISIVETKIEQLADQIFDDYCLSVSIPIDIYLWCAGENLDSTLIWLATNYTCLAEQHINFAEFKLEKAKYKTNNLQERGRISDEEAQKILIKIDILIQEIINIRTLHNL